MVAWCLRCKEEPQDCEECGCCMNCCGCEEGEFGDFDEDELGIDPEEDLHDK